ncbi:MAG: bifunctional homocysteine S-methyltransferase/methylenetetrahydrofolate reductase [Deltaproteobacteria bacterium]|nr:bifunctional homocysteine S-methyltransferase/methylenetetrahydrofolate reductase [Deltaproteobacteria bacterium]
MKPFLEVLTDEGLLADGAIGTEIYKRGIFINRCFDELNVSNPSIIRDIHQDYVNAGSGIIETNTFTANRPALAAHGFENRVDEINRAGVKLAREAAGSKAYVAGSVGPISWTKKDTGGMEREEMVSIFSEQIKVLTDEGVDAILLETFTHLDELHIAYQAARAVGDTPIITQVSLKYVGEGDFEGVLPEYAAVAMDHWGADVIGVNCCDGPQGVFEAVKRMAAVTHKPLSAMPNAGLPQMVQGRLLYLASPEYLAEYARRYAQLGVALIGGCCGTTPEHIREMKRFLKAMKPATRIGGTASQHEERIVVSAIPASEKSEFGKTLGKKFSLSVEVDPPLGIDPKKALDGAKILQDMGIDAVNIADGPRAMARMSPLALAVLIKEKVGIESIVHYCCRDRNLLGIQMDLIGASALGLNNVLLVTGDPPKMGHYPEASAVFDIDSVGLIRFVSNLNRGLDFARRPIKQATKFLIGCGVNPGAVDIDLEVERYKQKVESGAEFVFSQPIYDPKLLEDFFNRTADIPKIPFFIGILPLASLRNAEFLHNEVPGMQIPKHVLDKLGKAATHEAQQDIGLSVAKESLRAARNNDGVNGAYIFPPFGKYGMIKDLIKVLK